MHQKKMPTYLVVVFIGFVMLGCIGEQQAPTPTPTPAPVTATPTPTPTPQPTPTVTPTPAPSPYCGDGVLDPGEQCERGKECPEGMFCTINCTCRPFATLTPTPTPSPTPTPTPEPSATPIPPNVITDCGETIEARGNYTLGKDIVGGEGAQRFLTVCIRIAPTAAGSVLDCGGHMLGTSTGKIGILVEAPNTIIRNCQISAFEVGVKLSQGANGSVVQDNEISRASSAGIMADSVDGVIAANNSIHDSVGKGIYLVNANGNEVSSNVIRAVADGIYIERSIGNSLAGNNITRSTRYGIAVWSPSNILINNTVCLNNKDIYCTSRVIDGGGNTCQLSVDQVCYEDLNCTRCG